MKIQYGYILSLLAVVTAALGSSVEDVLGGLSNSQLENILNDLDYMDYSGVNGGYNKQDLTKSSNLDYDYEPTEDDLPHLESRAKAEESDVNDVPKTEPEMSQGNQMHANTMLPAYCDPPNPCPLGYTAADGCIDDFENTSEFSRRFQATQKCICDTEHMFDCPDENTHRGDQDIAAVNILAGIPGLGVSTGGDGNPYLDGQKLPVAAKKGHF